MKTQEKRKKVKKGGDTWLIVGVLAGIVLVVGIVILIIFLNRGPGADAQAKGKEPVQPVQGQPVQGDGGAAVPVHEPRKQEKPKSLLGNIRARAIRTERQNELRQIATFYSGMPSPPKSLAEFQKEIKRDAPAIHQAIEDGYYTINLKARQFSEDIVAYETEGDGANLHYFARASASVDAMSTDDLQKRLKE